MSDKRAQPRAWNRVLWGAWFSSPHGPSFLVGESWHKPRDAAYQGEPLRPLVFRSRTSAREWCRKQIAGWKLNPSLRRWRIKAVRVRETVKQF